LSEVNSFYRFFCLESSWLSFSFCLSRWCFSLFLHKSCRFRWLRNIIASTSSQALSFLFKSEHAHSAGTHTDLVAFESTSGTLNHVHEVRFFHSTRLHHALDSAINLKSDVIFVKLGKSGTLLSFNLVVLAGVCIPEAPFKSLLSLHELGSHLLCFKDHFLAFYLKVLLFLPVGSPLLASKLLLLLAFALLAVWISIGIGSQLGSSKTVYVVRCLLLISTKGILSLVRLSTVLRSLLLVVPGLVSCHTQVLCLSLSKETEWCWVLSLLLLKL